MFNWIHRECENEVQRIIKQWTNEVADAAKIENDLKLEILGLKNQLPTLLGQIKEQKAILEYAMHEKEQHIESLQAQLDESKRLNEGRLLQVNDYTRQIGDAGIEIERLKQTNTDLQNKLDNLINRGKRLTAEFKDLHKDKIDPTLPDNEYREALDKELSWQRTPDDDELDEINQTGCGPTLSDMFDAGVFKNIRIVPKETKPKAKTKRKKK